MTITNGNGNDDRLPYAERIAKLLRKAEGTDNEAEAEAYTAKAQQLMIRYAITEDLLAQAEGRQVQDEIVQEKIVYTSIFHTALFDIGRAIAIANGCKHLIERPRGQGSKTILIVIGFKSDVTNVKVLDASLQVQASTAMQRWYRQQDVAYLRTMEKFKMRRQFFMSFAQGLTAKLDAAKRAGVDDAVADEVARSGVDADVVRKSTDLVLKSKTEQIKDWVDNTYGSTLRTVRRNYSHGGYGAAQAGYDAGRNADTGQPRIGARRQIEG